MKNNTKATILMIPGIVLIISAIIFVIYYMIRGIYDGITSAPYEDLKYLGFALGAILSVLLLFEGISMYSEDEK